jgi:predicted enzyme related to lactoylglutathione lyase
MDDQRRPSAGPRPSALVLHTGRLEACAAFYGALGFDLHLEQHGDGPRHYALRCGGLHFALRECAEPGEAPAAGTPGSTTFGLHVDDVDLALERTLAAGGRLVAAARDRSFGRQARIADPDGRVIELLAAR